MHVISSVLILKDLVGTNLTDKISIFCFLVSLGSWTKELIAKLCWKFFLFALFDAFSLVEWLFEIFAYVSICFFELLIFLFCISVNLLDLFCYYILRCRARENVIRVFSSRSKILRAVLSKFKSKLILLKLQSINLFERKNCLRLVKDLWMWMT